MHHAIETVHVRRRKRYILRRVVGSFAVPVEAIGRSYDSEADARRAAERLGLRIKSVGTLYQITRQYTRKGYHKMNRKEAAYILDPATTREALAPYAGDCAMGRAKVDEACAVAAKVLRDYSDLRNELCGSCRRFVDAHNGACDNCRWKE